ncbi:MAG: DoxX family membrane protein [Chloroflexota bacterium]
MSQSNEAQTIRRVLSVLRITLGVILLVTWYENWTKGTYTADGIAGLFNYIFNDNGGGPEFYRQFVQSTILQAPGLFAAFQLVAELLLALGLIFGAFTPIAGFGAMLFFFNLFLAYFGGNEWIWTYVLLTSAAFAVAFTQSGRAFGIDAYLYQNRGKSPMGLLW